MKKIIPVLSKVLSDSNIDSNGLSWENLSIVGDVNIRHIIKKIIDSDSWFTQSIFNLGDNKKLSKKLKEKLSKDITPFIVDFNKEREEIVEKLKSCLTGVEKPLLPFFRKPESYFKQHVVFFPFNCGNDGVKKEWKSGITERSANYSGNERYHLTPFKSVIEPSYSLENVSYYGFYWQVEITSCTFMSYEELLFFKENKDPDFSVLWFKNSASRDVKNITGFLSIMQFTEPKKVNLKKSVSKLISFLKDAENFKEGGEIDMESFGEQIKEEYEPKVIA